jgi:hypothetical protein
MAPGRIGASPRRRGDPVKEERRSFSLPHLLLLLCRGLSFIISQNFIDFYSKEEKDGQIL